MSSENYKDQREIWKALRHGMHYVMGAPPSASMLNMLESGMRSKFIKTGGLRYGKSLGHPSNYAQLRFHHVLANTKYDMTGLMLAKISAEAKKQAYLMRTRQMLPLTFYTGGYL